jgi:hypothetical protein
LGARPGGFVFHDTRRCASTNFAAAGVPDVVAWSITDHRTASMHMAVQHHPESAQRERSRPWTAWSKRGGAKMTVRVNTADTRGGTDDLALQLDPEKARKYKPPSLSRV